jgi:hypothetical protein
VALLTRALAAPEAVAGGASRGFGFVQLCVAAAARLRCEQL